MTRARSRSEVRSVAATSGSTREQKLPARRRPQQERSQHTVDAILEATKALVVRDGLAALNTNRVARLAGVSIGSLYQYFPSKRALVAELRRRHQADGMALFRRESAAVTDMSVPATLRRFVTRMFEVHRQDPALHGALETDSGQGRFGETEKIALSLIRLHMELHRDEVGVADLDQAALVVGLTVEAVTHGVVLERPEFLEDPSLVDGIVRMLLAYLQHGVKPVS